MFRRFALLACLAVFAASGCGSSLDAQERAAAEEAVRMQSTSTQAGSAYCQAVQDLFTAQPDGQFGDAGFGAAMTSYAKAVEQVAALSSPDDSLALWELAATAELVAADPGNRDSAQRFGVMTLQVAPITVRAGKACGIAS